jgi:hypothetical protein
MPPGVPAGGIFKQAATHSTGMTVGVLAADPAAADLSPSSNFAPAASGGGMAANVSVGQASSPVNQPFKSWRSFDVVTRSTALFSNARSKTPKPIATASTPARQRAILPDLDEHAAATMDAVELAKSPAPKIASDSMVETTAPNQTLAALASVAMGARAERAIAVDPGDTQPATIKIRAGIVIYGAIVLTVGVSAPGLTSAIRRISSDGQRRRAITHTRRKAQSAR